MTNTENLVRPFASLFLAIIPGGIALGLLLMGVLTTTSHTASAQGNYGEPPLAGNVCHQGEPLPDLQGNIICQRCGEPGEQCCRRRRPQCDGERQGFRCDPTGYCVNPTPQDPRNMGFPGYPARSGPFCNNGVVNGRFCVRCGDLGQACCPYTAYGGGRAGCDYGTCTDPNYAENPIQGRFPSTATSPMCVLSLTSAITPTPLLTPTAGAGDSYPTLSSQHDYEQAALDLYKAGEMQQLQPLLEKGLDVYPESARLWSVATGYFFKHKDYITALHAAEKTVELAPSPTHYVNLGLVHHRGFKDYAKALTYYEKGETYGEKTPALYFNLAECYEKTGKEELAIANYTRYLKNDPHGGKAQEAQNRLTALQPGTSQHDRFTIALENIFFESSWMGTFCFCEIWLTLERGPTITLDKSTFCSHFSSGFSYYGWCDPPFSETIHYQGREQMFECYNCPAFLPVGRGSVKSIRIRPGKKENIGTFIIDVYPLSKCFTDSIYAIFYGRDEDGQAVEIRTSVFTPADYWSSPYAMGHGEKPRYRR